jgi:hypothetical protein
VVSEVRDHQLALAVVGEQVVGDAIALAGRSVVIEGDCGLAVQVHRGLVGVEGIEHRRHRLAASESLRGLGALPVHVDDEVGVLGEERLLPVGVAAIGATRIGVDELADRQAVRQLGRCDVGVDPYGLLFLGVPTDVPTAEKSRKS